MNPHDTPCAGLTRRQTLLALMGASTLGACGGGDGGGVAGVGTGGTGSFTIGPILGFGSIIVNGIRYDDSSATITSDDSAFRREDLRLGMMVAVQGTTVVNGSSTATRIALAGELVGPISSLASDGFVVLGQTVTVTGSTVFGPLSGGLTGLRVGQVVEVHGIAAQATNSVRATYIERKTSPSEYKVQGLVSAHDAAARRFSIGSLTMSYTDTSPGEVRVTPNIGASVRVRLDTSSTIGVYPVNRIRKPEDSFSAFNGEVEFKGTITSFTSTNRFTVNDLPVDASAAAFPEGLAGIRAGAFVEVKGILANGAISASRVKPDNDGASVAATGAGTGTEFELHGTVSAASATGSAGSFTLTSSSGVSVAIDWNSGVTFRDGTAARLVNGARVEVKGVLAGGSRVTASRISFES